MIKKQLENSGIESLPDFPDETTGSPVSENSISHRIRGLLPEHVRKCFVPMLTNGAECNCLFESVSLSLTHGHSASYDIELRLRSVLYACNRWSTMFSVLTRSMQTNDDTYRMQFLECMFRAARRSSPCETEFARRFLEEQSELNRCVFVFHVDTEYSKFDVDKNNSAASDDAYQRPIILIVTSGIQYGHALPLIRIDPKTPIPTETRKWLMHKPVEVSSRRCIVAGWNWNLDNFRSDGINSNENTGTEKVASVFRERISMVTQSNINNEKDQNVPLDSKSDTESAPGITEADQGQPTARFEAPTMMEAVERKCTGWKAIAQQFALRLRVLTDDPKHADDSAENGVYKQMLLMLADCADEVANQLEAKTLQAARIGQE